MDFPRASLRENRKLLAMNPTLLVQADRAAVYFRAARKGHKRSQDRYLQAKDLRTRDLMKWNRKFGHSYSRDMENALRAK